jgi:hypothetical protein
MLSRFDDKVLQILRTLAHAPNPLMTIPFIRFFEELSQPGAFQARRGRAFQVISQYLRDVYEKRVVVLIDEYDSPTVLFFSCIPAALSYSRPTISLLQYSVHFELRQVQY